MLEHHRGTKHMAILNYTTKIKPSSSIAEISDMLVKRGASKIVTDYVDGEPNSLTFWMERAGARLYFSLPCNWEGVLKALEADTKVPRGLKTTDQARRVGWRILKDWVEAQMAIIDAQMVSVQEVFLPYLLTDTGNTLYAHMIGNGFNTSDVKLIS